MQLDKETINNNMITHIVEWEYAGGRSVFVLQSCRELNLQDAREYIGNDFDSASGDKLSIQRARVATIL